MSDEIISHYRLVTKLGTGAHGEVWEGVHTSFEEMHVAIKILHPDLARDDGFVQRLKRECLTLHTLQHPNIVGFRDLVLSSDRPAMVMELVEGEDAFERVQKGSMPQAEVLKVGQDVLSALSFAHQKGVIHRDIKPSNLFLCADGMTKVLDFGIAKAVSGSQATKTGTIQGTLQYMAPEVFSGKGGTVAVDIYGLGLTFWEMLTGASACPEGSMAEQVGWHMVQGLESAVEAYEGELPISPDLLSIILRMAAKEPTQRYPSVEAILTEWAQVGSGEGTSNVAAAAQSIPPGTVTLDIGQLQKSESRSPNTLPPDSVVWSREAALDKLMESTGASKEADTAASEAKAEAESNIDLNLEKEAHSNAAEAEHPVPEAGGSNKTMFMALGALGCVGTVVGGGIIGGLTYFNSSDDDIEEVDELVQADGAAEDTSPLTAKQALVKILELRTGGSSEWDTKVKSILLRAFDSDGSQEIDSSEELAQINCDIWQGLEMSLLAGGEYSTGMLSVYGFDDGAWMGGLIGFSESLRSEAFAMGTACAQAEKEPEPTPEPAPSPSTSTRMSASRAASKILALPGGGSSAWDDKVTAIMLKAFDLNGNGKIDTSSETGKVTCEVWNALDKGMISGGEYTTSILSVYGFDPELMWIGSAVGFAESQRSKAYSKGASCVNYDIATGLSDNSKTSGGGADSTGSLSASEAATRILALTGGGSSAWDDKVEAIMLKAFDANGSGKIDTSSETGKVTCEVWNALDKGMISGGEYTTSIISVYGFDPDLMWVGSAVGFAESQRSKAYSKGASCVGYDASSGLSANTRRSGSGGGSNSGSSGGGSGSLSASQAASQIAALSGGGSSAWDDKVTAIMLRAFDANGSGKIDTSSETSSVTCAVWSAMDNGLRAGGEYSGSILSVYGFDPSLIWVGYAVGFSESQRSNAYSKGSSCLSGSGSSGGSGGGSGSLSASQAATQILALSGGGSSAWDDQVEAIMLRAFDANGSGKLDTSSEVSSVTCSVWSALDRGMKSGGSYSSSILAIYGFKPDYAWVGYAIGFSESQRSNAYSKGSGCLSGSSSSGSSSGSGGGSGSLSASQAATQILALSGGGSSAWDDKVEAIMLRAFDANGSGKIDTSSETSSVTCDVWSALDRGMRAGGEYSSSILAVYGFDPSLMWVGYAVGFAESQRSKAFTKAKSCIGY